MKVPEDFAHEDRRALVCEDDAMMPYIHPEDRLVFKDGAPARVGKVFGLMAEGNAVPQIREIGFENGDWVLRAWKPGASEIPWRGAQRLGMLVGIIGADGRFKLGPHDDGMDLAYIEGQLRARLPG